MLARPRAQHDRRIDDVGRPANAAELTRLARALIVELDDLDVVGREQPSEPHLTPAIAPLFWRKRRRSMRDLGLMGFPF